MSDPVPPDTSPVNHVDIRFARYRTEWRDADGNWPSDLWTHISDFTKTPSLDLAEYMHVEDSLCSAALAALRASGSTTVRLVNGEYSKPIDGWLRDHGLVLDVPWPLPNEVALCQEEAGRIFRACLRDVMWCEFDAGSVRSCVGHEMYVHVRFGQSVDIEPVLRELSKTGLHVEPFAYPLDEPGELLAEGEAV